MWKKNFISGTFYFLNFLKRGRERKREREETAHRRAVGETPEKGEEGERRRGRRREEGRKGENAVPFGIFYSFSFFNFFLNKWTSLG